MRSVELIVIDEISMMHQEQFTLLDEVMREAFSSDKPFAGKRFCFVGDFLQIEPVDKSNKPVSNFVFLTETWKRAEVKTYQLKQVVRQQDALFAGFLNNVRQGIWTKDMKPIVEFAINREKPKTGVVSLVATNSEADGINARAMATLSGEEYVFYAEDANPMKYNFKTKSWYEDKGYWDKQKLLVEKTLRLKVGAQVICLMNHGKLVNGDTGVVEAINEEAQCITVNFNRVGVVNVFPQKFHQGNEEMEYRLQIPLKSAWAITIHKSQGMTLDAAIISAKLIFADGQAYVSMSRVKSMDGLYLESFEPEVVSANDKALEFYGLPGNLRGPEAEKHSHMPKGEDPNGGKGVFPVEPTPTNDGGGNPDPIPTPKEEEMNKISIQDAIVENLNKQVQQPQPQVAKTTTQGGNMIKEYLVETGSVLTEDYAVRRIITNDPQHWLFSAKVLNEVNRGAYKYALLEDRFGGESFCVTITAFTNPLTGNPQKVDVMSAQKPKDVVFGYADFDAETIIRFKDYSSDQYEDMSKYGFVIGNSDKMVKRLVEMVKSVSGHAIHKGDSKKLRIKVLSHQEILKALKHLNSEIDAEKSMDGISIGAVEMVKYVYRNSGHNRILRSINNGEITNHTVRILTNINGVAGLVKGNMITNNRSKINARFRELGIIGKDETYDVFTSVDNFKKELGTDGTWEIITLEPHHGPGMVKTNDQMLAQYYGIPGVFEPGELIEAFKVVLDKAYNNMVEGKDIELLNNIVPERATTEAERIAAIRDGDFTTKTNKMAAMLNDLDLGIGISQTLMFMRANGLKKMFLDEYDSYGNLRKNGTCWQAPSRSKKSFVFMPWAYRAYIMTKEVIYLAGYDVDMTNEEGIYHEPTQTFMISGNQAAEILGKLGGADLDDEVSIHIRKMIMKDGQIRLVAFIVRTPNDWSEFHIIDVSEFGPVFLAEEDNIDLPTIYEQDFDKFSKTARTDQLPSKVNGSDRPKHAVWNWELTRYNYHTSLYKGAGVGGQVKTKMLWYSTFNAPFIELPCANEDMIDALQQCKGDRNDLALLTSWSDKTIARLLINQKIDAYWWYSRNMHGAFMRLKMMKMINSCKGHLSADESPIVKDFMVPREELVRETHSKMITWLNKNIQEIPELSITIHGKNQERFRKIVTELKNQFAIPSEIRGDKAAVSKHLDEATVAIANRFASYKERLNDDVKFHRFMLSLTRMSYIRKAESIEKKHDDRNNFDRWLFTSPKDSDHMVLEYFYEAMLWFRDNYKK